MPWNHANELSLATQYAGYRSSAALMLLTTVVMLGGACGAAAADASEKEALATPAPEAKEPAAVATLRVRERGDAAEYDRYRQTQIQRIKSPIVLASALRRPGISNLESLRAEKDQLSWLRDRIQVTAPPVSQVVQIRVHGADPGELQQIVNAVAQAYLTDCVIQPKVDAMALLNLKQAQYNKLMAELDDLKRNEDLADNGNAGKEEQRKRIQRLEVVTAQMTLSIQASAAEIQMPSRVELIDESSGEDGSGTSLSPR